MPKWAMAPFLPFLEHIQDIGRLLHLSMRGISSLRASPQVEEALAQADRFMAKHGGVKQPSREGRLEKAQEEAHLAQTEVDNDFPQLHAQAVIAGWGALEAGIREVAAAWLLNEPSVKSVEPVAKLKVRLSVYESMTKDERAHYLATLLEQDVASPLRQGASRFEALLKPLGLDGRVTKKTQKDLFEMHQVRNVLVHRRGVADRRLVEACPWLKLNPGDVVEVSHANWARYFAAIDAYALEVVNRVAAKFGVAKTATRGATKRKAPNAKKPKKRGKTRPAA